MFRSKTIATSIMALVLACAAGAASADAVKYRKAVMKGIGGHMGAMSQIAKGNVSHAGHMLVHAKALEATIRLAKAAFKDKALDETSTATDKVWSDWSGFAKKADAASKAANVLVRTLENSGDVGAAMKGLGKSCGGCHKAYRKKKKMMKK